MPKRRAATTRNSVESESVSDALRLAALVQGVTDYAIYLLTEKGFVSSWNSGAQRMKGYLADEAIGLHFSSFYTPEEKAAGVPAKSLQTAASEGRCEAEGWRVRKDGSRFLASVVIDALYGDSGEVIGFAKITRDITERRKTQAARLESERRLAEDKFRLAVEASPSGMVMIDSSGLIVLVNAETERLFGYQREELIGQSIDMLVPPNLRGMHSQHRRGFTGKPVARRMGAGRDLYGIRKDGTEFPVEIGLNPIHTENGLLVLSVVVDITERKLAQARVQNLQTELLHLSRLTTMGQMASSLAHELNQPLTAISNYVEGCRLLLDTSAATDLPLVRETMALVSEQALRAGNIIRRLREFVSRGETTRKVENLAELIEEASELALIGVKVDGISVKFAFHSTDALVLADKTQVQQVCINLVRNAVEAMQTSQRRELTITTARDGKDMIAVRVADTGSGITDEVRAQLFTPFVTTKSEGMGVGLSICRGIIESHGGQIDVEPNPQGGASFFFTLPAVEEAELGYVA